MKQISQNYVMKWQPKLVPFLTLFRMGLLTDGVQNYPLPKIYHTSSNDETWHSYILPKEDPKYI